MNPLSDPNAIVDCSLSCRLEWIGVSSNFFNFEVYTPALIIVLTVWIVRRTWRNRKKTNV